jgi:succinate dehydrogenase/fumarate reductase-like Fe-S protein
VRHFAKRIFALLSLAWRLLVHLACAPFRRTGLPKFRENYEADGIFALDAEERAVFETFSRCIGCGLCDARCAALDLAGRLSPSALAMTESRSLPDLDATTAHAGRYLDCTNCELCEAACPTGVPLRRLAAFVVAHGRAVPQRRSSRP